MSNPGWHMQPLIQQQLAISHPITVRYRQGNSSTAELFNAASAVLSSVSGLGTTPIEAFALATPQNAIDRCQGTPNRPAPNIPNAMIPLPTAHPIPLVTHLQAALTPTGSCDIPQVDATPLLHQCSAIGRCHHCCYGQKRLQLWGPLSNPHDRVHTACLQCYGYVGCGRVGKPLQWAARMQERVGGCCSERVRADVQQDLPALALLWQTLKTLLCFH
jgi:hypothetical protein